MVDRRYDYDGDDTISAREHNRKVYMMRKNESWRRKSRDYVRRVDDRLEKKDRAEKRSRNIKRGAFLGLFGYGVRKVKKKTSRGAKKYWKSTSVKRKKTNFRKRPLI